MTSWGRLSVAGVLLAAILSAGGLPETVPPTPGEHRAEYRLSLAWLERDPPVPATPAGTRVVTTTPTATAPATTTPTPTATSTIPPALPSPTATHTAVPTATPSPDSAPVLEDFEGDLSGWQVAVDLTGSGNVTRSATQAWQGAAAGHARTDSAGSVAQFRLAINDAAASHTWGERPGTWLWQRAYVWAPSSAVAHLGPGEYFALAGFWPSTGGNFGWWLEVGPQGELQAYGYDADGAPGRFRLYGRLPLDRWVHLEIGLHTQQGPGVKRAFAVLVDGDFYGWYHQGHLVDETYDRVAMGILATNSDAPLEVYVDHWYTVTAAQTPGGPDTRAVGDLQEQDFRSQDGRQWQIDWSTWRNDLRLDAEAGLYSAGYRLQSGRNLERMPDLSEGWAEIEIGWPQGTPPLAPDGYFGPMVGFRKEINREENLEVIPIGLGGGAVDLVLEAWTGGPVILARWPLPQAAIGNTHIPEAGDLLRVIWRQAGDDAIRVQASYYDASQAQWTLDAIDHTFAATAVGHSDFGPVNYQDGYHRMASITIDSPHYSIRRFKVGTLATAP